MSGLPMGPSGPPLPGPFGPGALGDLLRRDLLPGEEASVWNAGYPHGAPPHTDAFLARKGPDGKVYPVQKDHVPGS
jgi:hypothetical protein